MAINNEGVESRIGSSSVKYPDNVVSHETTINPHSARQPANDGVFEQSNGPERDKSEAGTDVRSSQKTNEQVPTCSVTDPDVNNTEQKRDAKHNYTSGHAEKLASNKIKKSPLLKKVDIIVVSVVLSATFIIMLVICCKFCCKKFCFRDDSPTEVTRSPGVQPGYTDMQVQDNTQPSVSYSTCSRNTVDAENRSYMSTITNTHQPNATCHASGNNDQSLGHYYLRSATYSSDPGHQVSPLTPMTQETHPPDYDDARWMPRKSGNTINNDQTFDHWVPGQQSPRSCTVQHPSAETRACAEQLLSSTEPPPPSYEMAIMKMHKTDLQILELSPLTRTASQSDCSSISEYDLI